MKTLNTFSLAPLGLALAMALTLATGAAKAATYSVNIDTSSIAGTTGSVG